MTVNNIIKLVTGLVFLVGVVFGAQKYAHETFAPKALAEEVQQNARQIRIVQLQEAIRWYQDQMNFILLNCNYNLDTAHPDARMQYYNYQNMKTAAETELAILMGIVQ